MISYVFIYIYYYNNNNNNNNNNNSWSTQIYLGKYNLEKNDKNRTVTTEKDSERLLLECYERKTYEWNFVKKGNMTNKGLKGKDAEDCNL